jgi:cytoskeletal protein RodZ
MISINKRIFFLIISLIFLSGGFAYAAIANNLKIPFIKNSQTKNIVLKNEEDSQDNSIKTKEEVRFVPTSTPTPTSLVKPTSSSKLTVSLTQKNDTNSTNQELKKTEDEKNVKEKEDNKKATNEVNHGGSFQYIDNELVLSLSREGNGVRLNWTRCNSNSFTSYKVVRSKTNSNLYYPNNDPIYSTGNQEELSYLDQSVQEQIIIIEFVRLSQMVSLGVEMLLG